MTDRRRHEPEGEPLACGHPTACLVYGGEKPACGWCHDVLRAGRDAADKHYANSFYALSLRDAEEKIARFQHEINALNEQIKSLESKTPMYRVKSINYTVHPTNYGGGCFEVLKWVGLGIDGCVGFGTSGRAADAIVRLMEMK